MVTSDLTRQRLCPEVIVYIPKVTCHSSYTEVHEKIVYVKLPSALEQVVYVKSRHPEVTKMFGVFKFCGQGQKKTAVADLRESWASLQKGLGADSTIAPASQGSRARQTIASWFSPGAFIASDRPLPSAHRRRT